MSSPRFGGIAAVLPFAITTVRRATSCSPRTATVRRSVSVPSPRSRIFLTVADIERIDHSDISPSCNLDSTSNGLSVERSSRELCKTLQCRRITYGDLPWNMCSSSSRSKREHIGAEPGIVGKQSQHVPSPRRAGHQANHPRSIEARDSVCAHIHSTRLADWLSIEQH